MAMSASNEMVTNKASFRVFRNAHPNKNPPRKLPPALASAGDIILLSQAPSPATVVAPAARNDLAAQGGSDIIVPSVLARMPLGGGGTGLLITVLYRTCCRLTGDRTRDHA